MRQRYFVEIYFWGRRLDAPYVTSVALASDEDLNELAKEAAMSNNQDEVKALFRYLVRIYEYRETDRGPKRGARIMDYVPRGEEGGIHGYAA
jgi:hypothetical protein